MGHDYNHWAPLRHGKSTHKYDRSPIKSTLDVISQLLKHPVQSYESDFGRVAGCVPVDRRQCRHRCRWAATDCEKRSWSRSDMLCWIVRLRSGLSGCSWQRRGFDKASSCAPVSSRAMKNA